MPSLLVLTETMTTTPEKWKLPGYRLLGSQQPKVSNGGGRPSGGTVCFVRKETNGPIQIIDMAGPRYTMAIALQSVVVIVTYRAPAKDRVEMMSYFADLQKMIEELQSSRYKVVLMGDMNAHLQEDSKWTNKPANMAGEAVAQLATETSLHRKTPTNVAPPAWTFRRTTVEEYENSVTPEGEKSITDHVWVDESLIENAIYHLNVTDNMRTDHAGQRLLLGLNIPDQKQALKPKPTPQRKHLERGEETAERYTRMAQGKMREWLDKSRKNRSRHDDPLFVTKAIEELEDTLIETMELINPQRLSSQGGSKSERKQMRKNGIIESLQEKIRRERKEGTQTTHAEMRDEILAEVEEEKRSTAQVGWLSSQLLRQGETAGVWSTRRKLSTVFRPEIPRAFFRENGTLAWRETEVLDMVRKATKELVDPSKKHLLGQPDEKLKETIRVKHRRYAQVAKSAREWTVSEEDVKEAAKYVLKTYQKRGACGQTGLSAEMLVLLEEQLLEVLQTVLEMIQRCGRTPNRWRNLLVVLAQKPGKPERKLSSDRPLVLAEILLKALERVVKRHQDMAMARRPLHPSIMAYRPGLCTGMAIFTLTETTMQARLQGMRVVLDVNDVKNAYGGMNRKRVEVFLWETLGLQGQLWELTRQLSGNGIYATRYHGFLTAPQAQRGGYAQGKVLSPNHSNIAMHDLMVGLEDAGAGVMVGGHLIVGVSWSDDFIPIVPVEKMSTFPTAKAEVMSRLEMQAQPSKLFGLPMFRGAKKWATGSISPEEAATEEEETEEKQETEDFCAWSHDHCSIRMMNHPYAVRHSGKLLGRLVGANGYRHQGQAAWTKRKANGAIKILSYMGAFSAQADTELTHMLYVYLVRSVITTAMLNTHMCATDYKQLRATQAEIYRRGTWAGKRVSQRVIIRELGKEVIDVALWSAKLGLLERIKRLGEESMQRRSSRIGGRKQGPMCRDLRAMG
jgi:hypothetical protein